MMSILILFSCGEEKKDYVKVEYRENKLALHNSIFDYTKTKKSSFIRGLWYDIENKYLIIGLNDTKYYHYCDVDYDTYSLFKFADSFWTFFINNIKNKYSCDWLNTSFYSGGKVNKILKKDWIENMSLKEKVKILLDIYWIWLKDFNIEKWDSEWENMYSITFTNNNLTNKILNEGDFRINIQDLSSGIFKISVYKDMETYLNSVWDIISKKEVYKLSYWDNIESTRWWNKLYTNFFEYDLTGRSISSKNILINTYLTHKYYSEWENIFIENIKTSKKYKIEWKINKEDIWSQFIVKDNYFVLLSRSIDKIYYWKMNTESDVIQLKHYSIGKEDLWCWWGMPDMLKWYIYIKDWNIITKWSCPIFLNHSIYNIEEEYFIKNDKWSVEGIENDFWEV